MRNNENVTMVIMDAKTVAKQDKFVYGILSGVIFLSEKYLYSHQGLYFELYPVRCSSVFIDNRYDSFVSYL